MNREQIEEAAKEYSGLTDNPKDPAAREKGRACMAFSDGAHWVFNAVWHDSSMRPADDERCNKILVETKRGIDLDIYDADYSELDSGIDWETEVIRWAYIDDLLPERMEKTV